jgi:hypothetical protein
MIQFLFSVVKKRSSLRPVPSSCTLRIEMLEPRYAFSGESPLNLEDWQSAIFNNGIQGTLPIQFSRDSETVDPQGNLTESGVPRYGDETLLSEINTWAEVYTNVGQSEILGSGWDHDGKTPLAILWDRNAQSMQFLRGEDFTVVNTLQLNISGGDLLQGTVAGYRYIAQHAIIHEGLVVVMCQRERRVGSNWVAEGVSFAYTQDWGQTFARIEQVGGGYDVPAIAGDVTDGIQRARSWSFANAFPEQSPEDRLGAWFPWADYLQKSGNPKGGQIGLFRARRASLGEPWVVEANKLVYETWETADAGGLHAHTAGMFTDGMASFWGDVSYRNRVVRHVADDLENYTTTTWTHQENFQGAWSPNNAKVAVLGNQAVAAAPGAELGDILVAGDEQAEVIMKVEAPEEVGDKAVITKLRGSFSGASSGSSNAGRLSIWLQHIRGVGYISKEYNSQVNNIDSLYFSIDGENWGTLLNLGVGEPYIYGDRIIVLHQGALHALELPQKTETSTQAPLLVNPGGFNLATTEWTQVVAPAAGNTVRRVLYVEGQYVYADTLLPLDVQPQGAPPVNNNMPLFEITSDGTNRNLGAWDVTGAASLGSQLHWLSAWHYSLDGNGVTPQIRIGNAIGSERESAWYSNNQWLPTLDYVVPSPASTTPGEQQLRLFTGTDLGPRRWLMAMGGLTQSADPTYPLAPDSSGNHELVQANLVSTTASWSTALTFGLSELSSFSSYFDANGNGTVHTIASIYKNLSERIDITFTKTANAAGVLSLDVYSSGMLLDKMSFKSIYWDREDQIRLVISNSPDELGVTMLVTRNGYGYASKSLTGSTSGLIPTSILLSNATKTQVTPLEWYAIQFSPTQALSTEEREQLIGSSSMFSFLVPRQPGPPDFDSDGDVDGRDFLMWQQGAWITADAKLEDGDSNADGRVDGLDLAIWQAGYGLGINVGPPDADFNDDGVIDDLDLAAWQEGYGIRWTYGVHAQGDADFDGDVDGRDFLIWQRQHSGPDPEEITVPSSAIIAIEESEVVNETGNAIVESVPRIQQGTSSQQALTTPPITTTSEPVVNQMSTANFWLAPLPVVNWIDRSEYQASALIADNLALQETALNQQSLQSADLAWGTEPGRILPENEKSDLAEEIVWSDAADSALNDWQTL